MVDIESLDKGAAPLLESYPTVELSTGEVLKASRIGFRGVNLLLSIVDGTGFEKLFEAWKFFTSKKRGKDGSLIVNEEDVLRGGKIVLDILTRNADKLHPLILLAFGLSEEQYRDFEMRDIIRLIESLAKHPEVLGLIDELGKQKRSDVGVS